MESSLLLRRCALAALSQARVVAVLGRGGGGSLPLSEAPSTPTRALLLIKEGLHGIKDRLRSVEGVFLIEGGELRAI